MWASLGNEENRNALKDRSVPLRLERNAFRVSCARLRSFDLLSLKQNSPTAQISKLRLQDIDLRLTDCQLQLNAIGGEVFLHH